jgi:hypothetical protein
LQGKEQAFHLAARRRQQWREPGLIIGVDLPDNSFRLAVRPGKHLCPATIGRCRWRRKEEQRQDDQDGSGRHQQQILTALLHGLASVAAGEIPSIASSGLL